MRLKVDLIMKIDLKTQYLVTQVDAMILAECLQVMFRVDQLRQHLPRCELHRATTGNVFSFNDTPVQINLAKVVVVNIGAILKLVTLFKRVLTLGRLLLCASKVSLVRKYYHKIWNLLLMRRLVQRSIAV